MRVLIWLAAACFVVATASEKKLVCYFGSWAAYRHEAGRFTVNDIDPSLCTHYVYAFVGIANNAVKVLDKWQDLPDDGGKDGFRHFNAMRERYPSMKTLVAIGGWSESSGKYSKMASSPESRATFVKSVVKFVKQHGFDGFDLDWEYPNQRGGKKVDIKNFSALLKELREAFDQEDLLLSAAVAAVKSSASKSYNIREIWKYLDFINLMTYDMHGSWENYTGINAPLYPGHFDTGIAKDMTVDAAVRYWLAYGVPAEKLNLGIATYGRSFTLADSKQTTVNAPIMGDGLPGPYTAANGTLGYNEICEMQKKDYWVMKFDTDRRVPYAYRGNQWVGYDNVKSVKEKADYVNKMGLGGAMIWSIETDDFTGACIEKYPLIKSVRHVLRNGL